MQMEAEARTSKMLEAEQRLLESIFPRHIIEALTNTQGKSGVLDGGGNDAVPSPGPKALVDPSSSRAGGTSQRHCLGTTSHSSFTNKWSSSTPTIRLLNASSDLQQLSTHHDEVGQSSA